MITQSDLKKTPLFENHLALQARMVPFGGWEMPVQYEGIIAEYQHTREAVTIFDTSHMGEFIVEGDCQATGLDRIVSMNIAQMPKGMCRYGLLLNDQGGVLDDLIVFRVQKHQWFIVVNGVTTQRDAEHFLQHLKQPRCFKDISLKTGKLDLQGPLSRDILMSLVPDVQKLDYFRFDYFNLLGEHVIISRTGYTGELGYEIYFPWKKTRNLWQTLLKNDKVKPAGLGARDVLRLEMGYSLYGHELNEDISPLESGLSRFVDFDKDFIGKEALLEQRASGLKRKIIGYVSDNRKSPRLGHKLYSEAMEEIGFVTSGTFAPSLNRGIGLGFVESKYEAKGTKIFFGNEKQKNTAMITERIFFKKSSLKN